MAEWADMAQDSVKAAGQCLRNKCYRSSVSRSYCAMFAAVTAALLEARVAPPAARQAWSHARLPELVQENLKKKLGRGRTEDVRKMLRVTYKIRVAADYMRTESIDEVTATRCLTDATAVCRHLEVQS